MAFGKKTGGKDFQPGVSGNPNGRPRLPEEIRELKKLKRGEIEKLISDYMQMRDFELKALILDPQTPIIEVAIAKTVLAAAGDPLDEKDKGDLYRLSFLLDRMIGGIKKPIQLEGGDEDSKPIQLSALSSEERKEMLRVARGEKKD